MMEKTTIIHHMMRLQATTWACVALLLCPAWQAFSEVPADQSHTLKIPGVADVMIPADSGYITDTRAAATPEGPLIIHIREAHTNYEGQQHLATILEHLVKRYGLQLILVEGGEGDADLSYLRSQGSRAARKELAEEYLKAGQLSGEEYFEIVSDYPMTLWGVDDQTLYDAHVELFLGV